MSAESADLRRHPSFVPTPVDAGRNQARRIILQMYDGCIAGAMRRADAAK
jgi:hypothetical protein